jgi:phosphatidylinositol alpha 1,6-mannosyltransferase
VTNGQDGFVTKANDVADLANAIRQLADNPALRASMGEAGRRRVENRDWSEAFEKFWNYSPE